MGWKHVRPWSTPRPASGCAPTPGWTRLRSEPCAYEDQPRAAPSVRQLSLPTALERILLPRTA
eukprot:15470509-Alexandrium_andersonii.AAC.1